MPGICSVRHCFTGCHRNRHAHCHCLAHPDAGGGRKGEGATGAATGQAGSAGHLAASTPAPASSASHDRPGRSTGAPGGHEESRLFSPQQ
jgi:hypothetical protein